MTFALLTRIGGLIISFHSPGVLVTCEIIICPTLQFSVSSWTTTSRRVLRTDSSIAALSHGTIDRRSISSMVVSLDRKSTRLNSSHPSISYAVFCLKKKKNNNTHYYHEPHYYYV